MRHFIGVNHVDMHLHGIVLILGKRLQLSRHVETRQRIMHQHSNGFFGARRAEVGGDANRGVQPHQQHADQKNLSA